MKKKNIGPFSLNISGDGLNKKFLIRLFFFGFLIGTWRYDMFYDELLSL